MVLGMRREGLDSEYTVTSSSGYLNSSEVKAGNSEVQRFPGIGFSSCAAPTFSHVQGISSGGYKLGFWNGPEWSGILERFRVEFSSSVD